MENQADKTYLNLLKNILENGIDRSDRTGTGTRSIFGTQMRFDISGDNFPILTSKKIPFKTLTHELLWFISGSTNIKYLVENNVNIWNEWPFKSYLLKNKKPLPETSSKEWIDQMSLFVENIKTNDAFAKEYGELGPVYGKQWRAWQVYDKDGNLSTIDQLQKAINDIKQNPESRRIIVSAWKVDEIEEMAKSGLPPCHVFFQMFVANGKLSLSLYQRSCDMFLGVPFNIASYALLTKMLAQVCDLEAGEFIWTGGDTHIYKNHFDQAKEQISRLDKLPLKLPKIKINKEIKDINKFTISDFELIDYEPLEKISAPIAV